MWDFAINRRYIYYQQAMNLNNKIYHTQTQYHACYLCALKQLTIGDF